MNERAELPTRRHGLTMPVRFLVGTDPRTAEPQTYLVKFNFGDEARIMECFVCQDGAPITKTGSQVRALIEDGCKAISRLLQYGDTMAELAVYFGEDREEGESRGRPSSVMGAIARAGADLDARAAEATT